MTASFLLGYEPNVSFQVIATVGDAVDTKADGSPYRMVGIPDGLGAFDNGDGTFTVVMNHELGATDGIVRDHGSKGSFVSEWVLNKSDLSIVSVQDAIKSVWLFNDATETFVQSSNYAIARLCSADLADQSAYYWIDPSDGTAYGTQSKIFMTGEESGTEGKEFAVFLTGDDAGKAFEFADCGLFAWENNLASPFAQKKTITIGQDDGLNGQVYVYVGEKQATGTDFQKAGLEDGHLYGIKVENLLAQLGNETDGLAASGRFSMYDEGVVGALTGAQLDAQGEANGVTSFQRPEDGHWDTLNPNVYWFVTTAGLGGSSPAISRLYKVTFDDITNPELGGTIEAVLSSSDLPTNGTIGPRMMDNITVNADGHVIIEEDVGNNALIGRILDYDPFTDTVSVVAQHDPSLFVTGAAGFITQDEEASGVIEITDLLGYTEGKAYLTSDQIHQNLRLTDAELTENGQFLAMYVKTPELIGDNGANNLFGSAANETFKGGDGDDTLLGGSGNDSMSGGKGDDSLNGGAGDDNIMGAQGNDVLFGGLGLDRLQGGDGADMFVFGSWADSKVDAMDKIVDFSHAQGDLIDLSALFGGTFDLVAGFTGVAGQLVIARDHADYVVSGDANGDGAADFAIAVHSLTALTAADFVL